MPFSLRTKCMFLDLEQVPRILLSLPSALPERIRHTMRRNCWNQYGMENMQANVDGLLKLLLKPPIQALSTTALPVQQKNNMQDLRQNWKVSFPHLPPLPWPQEPLSWKLPFQNLPPHPRMPSSQKSKVSSYKISISWSKNKICVDLLFKHLILKSKWMMTG